ncbi:MAG: hypothetical protein Fur0044_23910 [Anaerolineae bacterium]|nr:hypothetical protein [Anaerolineales bacterium]MCQ3973110.1 hypothetical protein [Anaerolineae bacterium]
MTVQQNSEAIGSPSASALFLPAWDESLAHWVSRLGSPPLLAIASISLSAQAARTSTAWGWAGFYILVAIVLPAVYVLWLVRQGKVTDFDLKIREQRRSPFLVTLVSALMAWLVLYGGQAPSELVLLTGVGWVQIALLLAITLHWKISAHCASAASFVVWAWFLLGVMAAPFIFLIPLIAWSRLRLQRHDLPQTAAGTLLGSLVLATTLYLVG